MELLVLGIFGFTLAHLALSLIPGIKTTLINVMGEKAWRGLFAAIVFISMLMIIFGWRSTPVEYAYSPSFSLRHITMALMLVAIILFGASKGISDIQRYIRHPMLTGIVVWSVAHLLSNGEVRSLLLFGGLGIWSILEIILVSKREGDWVKPQPAPMIRTLKNLIISTIVFLIIFMLHKYFTGVSLIPPG